MAKYGVPAIVLGKLALLGMLITAVILVSGCAEKPAEQIKTTSTVSVADAQSNSGQSLTSILSQYQGKNVTAVPIALPQASMPGKLKEVDVDYIVVEAAESGLSYTETIPISKVSGILVTSPYQGKYDDVRILFN